MYGVQLMANWYAKQTADERVLFDRWLYISGCEQAEKAIKYNTLYYMLSHMINNSLLHFYHKYR